MISKLHYTGGMHANINRILRRANHYLLEAYHSGNNAEQVMAAWSSLNPGSNIATRTWPRQAPPADLDGEETLHAARLLAVSMQLRLLETGALLAGTKAGPRDLVFLRGLEELDPTQVQQVHQACQGAGFCIRSEGMPPPQAAPRRQASLF